MRKTFSELVRESFLKAFDNWLIILIFFLPAWASQLFNYLDPMRGFDSANMLDMMTVLRQAGGVFLAGTLLFLLTVLMSLFGTAAAINAYRENPGDEETKPDPVLEGFKSLPAVLFIAIAVYVLTAAAAGILIAALVLPVAAAFLSDSTPGWALLALAGLIFTAGISVVLIAGAIIYNLSLRICILEEEDPWESLKRAFRRLKEKPGELFSFWLKTTLFTFGFYLLYWAFYLPVFGFSSVPGTEMFPAAPVFLAIPGGVLLASLQAVFAVTLVNLWTGYLNCLSADPREDEYYESW